MTSNSLKPLGHKAYGSIPHLPESRLGPGDHYCDPGQARIALTRARDQHDLIIVQEKLDGSNCSVAKKDGEIIALGRSGYRANSSPFEQHQYFHLWVQKNNERFKNLLREGERVAGEWLLQAHGTRYYLPHEPYVVFDILTGHTRMLYQDFLLRVLPLGFTVPRLIQLGTSYPLENALEAISTSGHGALDPVEGAVWRVERKGRVDFLTKYVRPDKQDGQYLPEISGKEAVWNVDPKLL
jgi:hypothetical protein